MILNALKLINNHCLIPALKQDPKAEGSWTGGGKLGKEGEIQATGKKAGWHGS